MSKLLKWDQTGEKEYETGVDHGVLYLFNDGEYKNGVVWNGLISVTEQPSGAEETKFYADNIPYLSLRSAEEFGASLECYMYPEEWKACNGESELSPGVVIGQQRRQKFGLVYRTKKGNDADGEDYAFKYHLIYGCTTSPAERTYESVNDSPSAITFTFDISTTPVDISGKDDTGKPFKPVSILTVDSSKCSKEKIEALEAILFGDDGDGDSSAKVEPRLPLPDEIKTIMAAG